MIKFNAKEHFYTLDGEPLIGTTTALSVIAKPLTWWSSGMAVGKMGWTNPKYTSPEGRIEAVERVLPQIKGMTTPEYLKLLDEAYKAHSVKLKDSAQAGTDLHEILEVFVRTGEVKDEKIRPFVDWAKENVKRWLWSEAICYSKDLWVAGTSDVGAELKTGDYVVIDFKSSKEKYFSHDIQAGGYALQIEENGWYDADGKKLGELDKPIKGVAIVPFGAKKVEPIFNWEMDELKTAFKNAVALYKIMLRNNAI